MASHMGVQTAATKRNSQAELIVDFTLNKFIDYLLFNKLIVSATKPIRQKPFLRDDCSDVYDHFVELKVINENNSEPDVIQLWGQTTCYKGNSNNKPEPNKVYELRETLIESLRLRSWLRDEKSCFRTFHITFGPIGYSYGWISAAKEKSFDLSVYPKAPSNLYEEMTELFAKSSTIASINKNLELAFMDNNSSVGLFIRNLLQNLNYWFQVRLKSSNLADLQADLLTTLRKTRKEIADKAITDSFEGGEGIKGIAQKLFRGGDTTDKAMEKTVKRLAESKPFLSLALNAVNNWQNWCFNFKIPITHNNLESYLTYLWDNSNENRLVNRRLLLRINHEESIEYIQDVGIEGISEHNLYKGNHSLLQTKKIIEKLLSDCRSNGINEPEQLQNQLVSKKALDLIKQSLNSELKNGTTLTPSLFYVEESLSDEFEFKKRKDTNLLKMVGYQDAFCDSQVSEYQNMKVVYRKSDKKLVAILKVAYFSKNEFPRRVKENSYVGLTTKYSYVNKEFVERYPTIPLLMFVDMEKKFTPPEYAVRGLVNSGWNVFFSIVSLRNYLNSL